MTYDDLIEARDWAERAVWELREQLVELCPEEYWEEGMIQEMNDAESEVDFFQQQLDTGDYTD